MQSLATGGLLRANLTIRNPDDGLKARLRLRAAQQGHSMEEVRCILRRTLQAELLSGQSLVDSVRASVEPYGGIELELPVREPMREPPDFR